MACLSRHRHHHHHHHHHRAWLTSPDPDMLHHRPLSAHHRPLPHDDALPPLLRTPHPPRLRHGRHRPHPRPQFDGPDPIWDAVRQEAKREVVQFNSLCASVASIAFLVFHFNCVQAEKEPILSSFLYASILAHDCLEQALVFVLANRLQNPTLLATQLLDIFSNVVLHHKPIQRSIRLDVQAFKDRDPACLSYCSALLYMKGFHALQVYRIAHALWHQGRKVLALALQSRVSEVFGVDIHPAAKIGEGILLDHGTGVVIGETAIVGNRVSLLHGVTLGGTGKEIGDRHPKVGEGALIGASATILGNITIGEGAMIAAGSLVLKDVPPHSIAAGIPAKVICGLQEHDPSLTMKHDATKDFFTHVATNFRDEMPNG
ncbi:hypothetical protein Fmac_002676 [Flemingia macrophylla]|uniref:serine O-acetyltransferase n=1 Tax=Flemingia macrophylla TaxID=520843 RepID=A0ABD1NL88_9FABA